MRAGNRGEGWGLGSVAIHQGESAQIGPRRATGFPGQCLTSRGPLCALLLATEPGILNLGLEYAATSK